MILLLLLDAFRWDYLQKTKYLRGLAASGASGTFEEPFGFAGHPSYFAGLTPGQAGYSNQFWFDAQASPFRAADHYPDPARLGPELGAAVRNQIRTLAAAESTEYVRSYIYPHAIPTRLLPSFDLPAKFPPWDPRCGYHSIFHDLDRESRGWLYAGWPVLNQLGLTTDRQIVDWVLANARPEHAIVHAQLCELDAAGHYHGPSSRPVLNCIQRTDALVEELVEGLSRVAGRPDVIAFGDHGMVPVVRHVDLMAGLDSLPVTAPADFVYFLDSTMARFWYNNATAKSAVLCWLRQVPGGHLLSEPELHRWGMTGADRRNGEDIWLADPGVLICPNFFHRAEGAPVGMHGYAPDERDNEGIFVAHGPSIPSGWRTGSLNAQQLHSLVRSRLFTAAHLAETVLRDEAGTQDRLKQDAIERDLSIICDRIDQIARNYDAMILCGSFGRGEGSVIKRDGVARAMNDYDLTVIAETPPSVKWKKEGRCLAVRLGLPYVDLVCFPAASLDASPPTILNYDFRYGSRVLRGNSCILDRMPHLAEDDIASSEVLALLLNRASGLLIRLTGELLNAEQVPPAVSDLLWTQIIKLGIAVADHYLFSWHAYHTSYSERRRRFATLGKSAELEEDVLGGVDLCFELKLHPDERFSTDPRLLLREQTKHWQAALVSRFALEVDAPDLAAAATGYLTSRPADLAGQQQRVRCCAAFLWHSLGDSLQPDPDRLRYASQMMGTAGIPCNETEAHSPVERYEQLRSAFVTSWEATCH